MGLVLGIIALVLMFIGVAFIYGGTQPEYDEINRDGKSWKLIKGTRFYYRIDEKTAVLELGLLRGRGDLDVLRINTDILLYYGKPLIPTINKCIKISNDNKVKDFSKIIAGSITNGLYRFKYIRANYKDFIDFNCFEMSYNDFLKVIDALEGVQEEVEAIDYKLMIERNNSRKEKERLEKLYESIETN